MLKTDDKSFLNSKVLIQTSCSGAQGVPLKFATKGKLFVYGTNKPMIGEIKLDDDGRQKLGFPKPRKILTPAGSGSPDFFSSGFGVEFF